MTVKDEIEDRLTAAFRPAVLEVVNESHLHAGHCLLYTSPSPRD